MKRLVLSTVIVTALAVIMLYRPVSLVIYKLREPYFKYPIKTSSAVIRNDGWGSGEFGAKRKNGRVHTGIDMAAPVGTTVYAAKSGVAFCGNVPTGYGKYVMIYHPDGSQTIYGHLASYVARSTQKVRMGERIGYVGKTGNASRGAIQSHLHFEILKDGVPQNPRTLMR